MAKHKSLWRSERGSIAVTFAIMLIPLLMVSGGAIDLIRAQTVQTQLQSVADAGIVAAAARLPKNETADQTQQEVAKVVSAFFAENRKATLGSSLGAVSVKFDNASNLLQVDVTAEVPMSFLKIFGISKMDVAASATAKRAQPGRLNLALVLDITESMKFYVSGKAKIDTMKEAAQDLTDKIMVSNGVKIGVMPFLHYVNIGTRYSGKPWISVQAPINVNNCSYPNATGCAWRQSTCDGMPCQVWSCTNQGQQVCTTQLRSWTGCVGVRREQYHGSIADATTVRYSGFVSSYDTVCGPSLLPLTTSRSDVTSAISGLYYVSQAQTYIPGGLLWGWNMLTPEEPMDEADTTANLESKGGLRVMVLMTDGVNTYSPQTRTGMFTALHANSVYQTGTYTDALTSSLCTSIKQQGIVIYTVLFDVNTSSMQQLMRDCASDPGKAYTALTSDELKNAFSSIVANLQKVTLTQ